MTLKIAVNKNCFNKENVSDTAAGWLNINESLEWLQGWVTAGYGWCATHFVDRRRRADNARGSNLVVVDIDGDHSSGFQGEWRNNNPNNDGCLRFKVGNGRWDDKDCSETNPYVCQSSRY